MTKFIKKDVIRVAVRLYAAAVKTGGGRGQQFLYVSRIAAYLQAQGILPEDLDSERGSEVFEAVGSTLGKHYSDHDRLLLKNGFKGTWYRVVTAAMHSYHRDRPKKSRFG